MNNAYSLLKQPCCIQWGRSRSPKMFSIALVTLVFLLLCFYSMLQIACEGGVCSPTLDAAQSLTCLETPADVRNICYGPPLGGAFLHRLHPLPSPVLITPQRVERKVKLTPSPQFSRFMVTIWSCPSTHARCNIVRHQLAHSLTLVN